MGFGYGRNEVGCAAKKKGIADSKGQLQINIDEDLPQDCAYVDFLLASSLKRGRCSKLLRNFMVAYAARLPQRADGRDYLFGPEAICETIKVLEGQDKRDLTKGPFQYEKGPLSGLWKKHFFQASFLAENILKELEREGVGLIFRKLSEHYGRGNYMGKVIEEADLALVIEAITRDSIERRARRRASGRDGGLTGEHLIYAALPTGNIYLYASFHDEDPDRIAESVRVSLQDFPQLAGTAPIFS